MNRPPHVRATDSAAGAPKRPSPRIAWAVSITLHFFLLTFAVGAILPPVVNAPADLPVQDRPLTIRWVPSQPPPSPPTLVDEPTPVRETPLAPMEPRKSRSVFATGADSTPRMSKQPAPLSPPEIAIPTRNPVSTQATESRPSKSPRSRTGAEAASPLEPARPPSTLVAPRRVSAIEPDYPQHCIRGGHEGLVRFSLEISATGEIEQLEVLEPKPCHHLVAAAREAIQNLQYEPARLGGIPIAQSTTLEVRFRLNPE